MTITELEKMKEGLLLLDKSVKDRENHIQLMKEIIKSESKLSKQEKKYLKLLKDDYYDAYFEVEREEFAKLEDIPRITNDRHRNLLSEYSYLNVDEVCKIICLLFKEYENKEVEYRRLYLDEYYIYGVTFSEPYIAIGEPSVVDNGYKDKRNIVILWKTPLKCNELTKHNIANDNPVCVLTKDDCDKRFKKRYHSNYQRLISTYIDNTGMSKYGEDKIDVLYFDYRGYDFIVDLIYNLAYYQKMHNIRLMSGNETWDVFRKIYKK